MKQINGYRMIWMLVGFVAVFVPSSVSAQPQSGRPVADAGLSRYAGPDPIVLDGTGSYDPDESGPLSYSWQQISGPTVIISEANTAKPTISGFVQTEEIQECEFELVVNDGELTSVPDTVKVSIVRTFNYEVYNSVMVFANERFGEAFDPQKPTVVYFGGGTPGVGPHKGGGTWSGGWGQWKEKANVIYFDPYHMDPDSYLRRDNNGMWDYSTMFYSRCADRIIVFLSAVAPDYKGAIQTIGQSLGGIPAIDVALRLNKTYADARYAVNRVTFLDEGGYYENSARFEDFIANPVEGEQCWLESYVSLMGGFYPNALNVGFRLGEGMSEDMHLLASLWYFNSLGIGDMNVFNNGVIAGSYWSVVGPGRNLQLA
ncbi:MAG: PKD domain-containing protein, partial [Planctomycetota bacterium]